MKRFLLLSCMPLALLTSCAQREQPTQQNEAVVKSMFEAFNRHDWQAMAEHYTDSASFLDPSFGNEYVSQTRSEVVAKYAEMQKMFPYIHDEVVGIYPFGEKVIVEFISTGTADSISFRLPISTVFTLRKGKIVKDATYYDQ